MAENPYAKYATPASDNPYAKYKSQPVAPLPSGIPGKRRDPAAEAALADARKRAASAPGQIRALSGGAAFNFADEADAAAAALETGARNLFARTGLVEPAPYSSKQAFDAVMQAEREASAKFGQTNPIQNIALGITGGVASGGGPGMAFIKAAPNLGSRILRSAGVGAGGGAVAGAGAGNTPSERTTNALLGGGLGSVVGGVIPAVAAVPGAVTGGRKIFNKLRPEIENIQTQNMLTQQAAEEAATKQAAQQSALAQTATAEAEKAAAVKAIPFSEGNITTLSERGAPIQNAATKAKSDIIAKRAEERAALAAPVMERVAQKESGNQFISDIPEAKALLKESENIVNPSPTKSPTATSLPTPEEGRVYNYIINAFKNRLVEVPETYAKSEAAAGNKIVAKEVTDFATGERSTRYFRQFKTSYEAVDNLRRRFGDVFHGADPVGFEGVSKKLIQNSYGKLKEIQRQYVGEDLYDPMQDSYSKFSKMLEPYNETNLGKSISGKQKKTGIENLTPAQIRSAILEKGAGGLEQAKALGANVEKFLSDELATVLHNPKTGEPLSAAEAKGLLYNTKLGDAVKFVPKLDAAVQKHIAQLDAAEASGAKAKEFAETAKVAIAEAEKAGVAATKAAEAKRAYESEIIKLKKMTPREMAAKSESITKVFDDAYARGAISKEAYEELLKQTKRLKANEGVKNMLLRTAVAGGAGAFVASTVGSNFLNQP